MPDSDAMLTTVPGSAHPPTLLAAVSKGRNAAVVKYTDVTCVSYTWPQVSNGSSNMAFASPSAVCGTASISARPSHTPWSASVGG